MMYEILEIKLGMVKAFLIKGESHILVDAGLPNTYAKFIDFFKQNNIDPRDISLIVISYNHLDHVGELEKLHKLTGSKVVIHKKESIFLTEGNSTPVNPVTLKAKLLFKFMKKPAGVKFKPHIEVEDVMMLEQYGFKGRIVHTPGHTEGSLSILMENGEAIVADMLTGKKKGSSFTAKLPFVMNDMNENKRSLSMLIKEGAKIFYTSHGSICNDRAVLDLIKHNE